MSADLTTFSKVRALHDSTGHAGERDAAAGKMVALAAAVGLTVAEAVAQLDGPIAPLGAAGCADEFEAYRVERERERIRAARWKQLVAEYGSEAAVFAPTPAEAALEAACRPLLLKGERDAVSGWHGGSARAFSV